MKAKFSALGSVYKGDKAKYLKPALDSLLNQTSKANEIILVQDGPVSKEIEDLIIIYKKFLPLNVIKIKKNVGLGKALNIGLSNCSNEIIARFDSDDINRLYRFELQLEKINSDKNIDMVAGHISEFKLKIGDIDSIRKSALDQDELKRIIFWKNPINHVTVMFKKSAILDAGGYKDHLYMEDYNLWIRMFSNLCKIKIINKILVDVRIGDKMINRRRGLAYVKSEFKLMKVKLKYLKSNYVSIVLSFCFRFISRLMPLFILSIIYKQLREK